MEQRFTWHAKKAATNLRDHGVSFDDAIRVFSDPFYIQADDINDPATGEQRYIAIGRTDGVLLVAVVFVDRSELGVEVFHLISARKAVDYEKRKYQDQF